MKSGKTKLWSRPITSVFSTASVCNYRCKFCQINSMLKNNPVTFPNLISLSDFKKLKFFGKSTMGTFFFGNVGEPLANKDFGEIAKNLKKKGIYLDITTNASLLTPAISDQLIKIGFDHLLISFHAGKKETYEALQNKTFDTVTDNIRYLTEHKKRYPEIFFNFALNKINAEEIPDLISVAKKLGINGILLNHYHHCKNTFEKDISFYDNPEEGNKFVDRMYALGSKAGLTILPARKPYLKNIRQKQEFVNRRSEFCKKPFQELNLYSNFDTENTFDVCVCNKFFPFQLNWKEFGDQDMDLVWNHPVLQYLRKTKGRNSMCKFCQNKKTPYLRNLDNDAYRKEKDMAINSFLAEAAEFSPCIKPVKGLRLLKKNTYGDFF